MKKPEKKKLLTGLLITAVILFAIGSLAAYFGLIYNTFFITETFSFRAKENPALFGLFFSAELIFIMLASYAGIMIVLFMFSRGIAFIITGLFLLSGGIFFIYNAIFKNTKNETGHLITFIIFGILFIAIAILMFAAHFKIKNNPVNVKKKF
jgi:hypothetical protein